MLLTWPARTEQLREDATEIIVVTELAAPLVLEAWLGFCVLAIELALGGALSAGLVELAGIIALALVRVADDGIGGRDFLEPPLDLLVAGIEVGVVGLGELAVGRAYVLIRRGLRYTKHVIGGGHRIDA